MFGSPLRALPLPLRLLACALALLTAATTAGFGAPGANPTPTDSERVTEAELETLRAMPAPALTAKAAVLMDAHTGRVLWSRNGDERLPMASTTKMMTALLASQLAEPEEVATVYPRDLVGGSSIDLQAGETITIEELLYGAMLQSGNDAAVTIADHVGREHLGGVGDAGIGTFVDAMNRKARELGLEDTHFENPNGFDEPGHYSSALDLATLGGEVLEDPLLAGIVATSEYRVTGYVENGRERTPVYHPVETTNELLNTYRGANGVKTGTTPRAGEALVASVERGEAEMIAVVLGATDRFGDVRSLFDWGLARYEWLPLSSAVFSAASGATRGEQETYVAVEKWNTDMTFYDPTGRGVYWVATQPIEAPAAAEAAP